MTIIGRHVDVCSVAELAEGVCVLEEVNGIEDTPERRWTATARNTQRTSRANPTRMSAPPSTHSDQSEAPA